MSWMDELTEDQRAEMDNIVAGMNHARVRKPGAKYFRVEKGKVVEKKRPSGVVTHSMFPYKSTSMAVDPSEIGEVQENLRKHGVMADFDDSGRPIITSTKQHAAIATALGMKTGRDGYGHVDEHGGFQNSGRRRNDEIQEGQARVRGAQRELMAMPESVPAHVVQGVLDEYDIGPTEENTG